MVAVDRLTAGELLACYRERKGISRHRLAIDSGAAAHPSAYIQDFEEGRRAIPKRRIVVAYARVLDLDPWETDHFLFAWGFAPVLDWQKLAQDMLADVGYGGDLHHQTEKLYRAVAHTQTAAPVRPTPEETPNGDQSPAL